jgi:hypothetical protein
MPNSTNQLQHAPIRKAGKLGAAALLLTLALGSTQSWAFDRAHGYDGSGADPSAYQGFYGRAPRFCVPANGAQIWGGFAAPGDLIDPVSGETCPR